MSEPHYLERLEEFNIYRDKFLARLDDERVMHIPELDMAKMAVQNLRAWIVEREAASTNLAGLVQSADQMAAGYDAEEINAARIYRLITG